MKISVVTPTIHTDRLEIVAKSLANQTFTDFEWLVCSPHIPEVSCGWVKDDFEGGVWSLNRAYNKLFKMANGELIVSLQDDIWVQPCGLEKFYINYQESGGIISGVGDQYEKLNEYGKPTSKVWSDPRKTDKYGTFYECNFGDIEYNWCAIPHSAIFSCGGADEELDFLGYGGDLLQMSDRLNDMGYHFWLDQTNESFSIRHEHPKDWDEKHIVFNGLYDRRKESLKNMSQWPVLKYLSEVLE